MKLTYQEIIEKLKNFYISVDNFAYDEYPDGFYQSNKHLSYEERNKKLISDLGLGEFEEVHRHGGEGMGDHWESVKYFKDHDVYIQVVGFYTSHEGTSFYDQWNCCSEVKPKEKIITVYE